METTPFRDYEAGTQPPYDTPEALVKFKERRKPMTEAAC